MLNIIPKGYLAEWALFPEVKKIHLSTRHKPCHENNISSFSKDRL